MTVLTGIHVPGQNVLHQRLQIQPDLRLSLGLAPLKTRLTTKSGRKSRRNKVTVPLNTSRPPLQVGPSYRKRVSDLTASAHCPTRNGVQQPRSRSNSPPSPVNMYVGANFSVRLHQWFRFEKLVTNSGAAGVVHTEFNSFRRYKNMELSEGGEKIKNLPNAGGSSEISEILSYEMLKRCFGAQLVKTEMEVEYFPEGGSITDMVVNLFGQHRVGVSVTRAFRYNGEFETDDALRLLNKKLNGVLQSSRNTLEKWSKQILHVWAPSKRVANVVTQAYALVAEHTRSNTVVLVTTAADAPEIFTNK